MSKRFTSLRSRLTHPYGRVFFIQKALDLIEFPPAGLKEALFALANTPPTDPPKELFIAFSSKAISTDTQTKSSMTIYRVDDLLERRLPDVEQFNTLTKRNRSISLDESVWQALQAMPHEEMKTVYWESIQKLPVPVTWNEIPDPLSVLCEINMVPVLLLLTALKTFPHLQVEEARLPHLVGIKLPEDVSPQDLYAEVSRYNALFFDMMFLRFGILANLAEERLQNFAFIPDEAEDEAED